jgi:CBS domain-containing protein
MKVSEVMTRGVELVDPEATVQQAATVMAEHDIGAVPVGSEESLQGILTDRDIILRVVVEGDDPSKVRVREAMSPNLVTCREDDSLETVFQQMSERQVRRLPVLDEQGRVLGIVTMSDLARGQAEPEKAVEALRNLAEPHRQRGPSTQR